MTFVQIVMFSFGVILIYESLKPVVSKFVDSLENSFKKDQNAQQDNHN